LPRCCEILEARTLGTTLRNRQDPCSQLPLDFAHPAIWRRIQVPEVYTFWEMHVAIQNAMGWTDSHLHQFEVKDLKRGGQKIIGIPEALYEGEIFGETTIPGWTVDLRDYLSEENLELKYVYDFGDNWEHRIELEHIFFGRLKQKYPLCIDGERACPPEDCGSIPGYNHLLAILSNPSHEDYKSVKIWAGKTFNPESFDPKKVKFKNPTKHLREVWNV
jgi:hypothetical protein